MVHPVYWKVTGSVRISGKTIPTTNTDNRDKLYKREVYDSSELDSTFHDGTDCWERSNEPTEIKIKSKKKGEKQQININYSKYND